MPKAFVPHTFRTGDAIDPRQVNENALALYSHAKAMERDRYNYFPVVLPVGEWEPTVSSEVVEAAQVLFKVPEDGFEIVDAQLYAAPVSAAPTAQVVTLDTSSLTGFAPVTVTTSTTQYERKSSSEAQAVTVDSGTDIVFEFTVDGGTNDYMFYAVLWCRYDCIYGYNAENSPNTISLPDPPQVKDGETFDTTEWSTWHTAMDTYLDRLTAALTRRRSFEVLTFGKDPPGSMTAGVGQGSIYLPGRSLDYLEDLVVYVLGAVGGQLDVALENGSPAQTVGTNSATTVNGTTWKASGAATIGNPVVSNSAVANHLELTGDTNTGATALDRNYITLCWREQV